MRAYSNGITNKSLIIKDLTKWRNFEPFQRKEELFFNDGILRELTDGFL